MKLSNVLGPLFALIDAVFDAGQRLWAVMARGAFQTDAQSLRGSRFAPLPQNEVLLREVDLNAADEEQAQRAIALDPERHLPLAPETVLFAVAGPLDTATQVRAKPERQFLLAIVRKDALARLRAERGKAKSQNIEAFVYSPPDNSKFAFAFTDETGQQRRRFRRSLILLSFLVFAAVSWDTWSSWRTDMDEAVMVAEAERLQAERRVRLAERQATAAEASATEANTEPALPLPRAIEDLSLLAFRLTAPSDIVEIEQSGAQLIVRGHSYDPSALELEFRRSFEGRPITFNANTGDAPQRYEARIRSLAPESPNP